MDQASPGSASPGSASERSDQSMGSLQGVKLRSFSLKTKTCCTRSLSKAAIHPFLNTSRRARLFPTWLVTNSQKKQSIRGDRISFPFDFFRSLFCTLSSPGFLVSQSEPSQLGQDAGAALGDPRGTSDPSRRSIRLDGPGAVGLGFVGVGRLVGGLGGSSD